MAQKDASVAELTKNFEDSTAVLLTEYRGLTVAQMAELRSKLRGNATYSVVKNTLTERAAKEAGVESAFEGQLVGPNAIAFVEGDPVEAAKGLRDFAKDNPLLVIKGGVMDGKILDADAVKKLADLESREVLLAKLAGGMKANLTKAAVVFNALPSKAARGLGALQDKAAADPSVIGGAGEACDQEPKTTTPEASAAQDNTNE